MSLIVTGMASLVHLCCSCTYWSRNSLDSRCSYMPLARNQNCRGQWAIVFPCQRTSWCQWNCSAWTIGARTSDIWFQTRWVRRLMFPDLHFESRDSSAGGRVSQDELISTEISSLRESVAYRFFKWQLIPSFTFRKKIQIYDILWPDSPSRPDCLKISTNNCLRENFSWNFTAFILNVMNFAFRRYVQPNSLSFTCFRIFKDWMTIKLDQRDSDIL